MRKETDEILIGNLEIARTPFARLKGLLGRRSLPEDGALWIEPCSSIHTWWMRFVIDAVFVDQQGRVVKVAPHLAPWQMSVALGAQAVIEFAAGAAERHRIRIGETLEVREPPDYAGL